MPKRGRWWRGLRLNQHQALDGGAHLVADKVDHGVDVDAAGHVPHEEHQRAHADKGEQDADAERQMGDEQPLTLRADAAQDHQGIGEGPEGRCRA